MSSLLVVILRTPPMFQTSVSELISVCNHKYLFFMLLFVFRDSVNHLLEENQRYLSQLTSLLQETTEEKSESIMVSAFCRFIMKFIEFAAMTLTAFVFHTGSRLELD